MKWTDKMVSDLKDMAYQEVPNGTIAAQLGVPVQEVHAKRSQLGITMPKVKAAKAGATPTIAVNPDFEAALPTRKKAGMHRDVREAFVKLNSEVLITMARDNTSEADCNRYYCLLATLSGLSDTYNNLIGQGD